MATKKEIELCQEILGLSIQLNANGKHSVFVDFSGHVNQIEVRIKPAPWDRESQDIDGWSVGDKHVYLSKVSGEEIDLVVDYKVERLEFIKGELAELLAGEVSK